MPEPEAPLPPAALRLHLTLQRDPATRGWQADLQAEGAQPQQHFDSLPALIAWLARLETAPPVRGIR
jgi:hypothetical protein